MYKSDIYWALTGLGLVRDGFVWGLISAAQEGNAGLDEAMRNLAVGDEPRMSAGRTGLRNALQPLAKRLAEFSVVQTAVELHGLSRRFDSISAEYPRLKALLAPGRQAVIDLTAAFDAAAGTTKRTDVLVRLVRPATELYQSYAFYTSLTELFREYAEEEADLERHAVLELNVAEDLQSFAQFTLILSSLATAAGRAIEAINHVSDEPELVRISAIESGSPIKFTLFAGKGTLKLLLTMLGDASRIVYQAFTPHGRVHQAMETFTKAKQMGIDSPEILDELEAAVLAAATIYGATFKPGELVVNGTPVERTAAPPLEQLAPPARAEPAGTLADTPRRQLEGPKPDAGPDAQ